jgi:hypothetical protein
MVGLADEGPLAISNAIINLKSRLEHLQWKPGQGSCALGSDEVKFRIPRSSGHAFSS